jgi:hypothetical protein
MCPLRRVTEHEDLRRANALRCGPPPAWGFQRGVAFGAIPPLPLVEEPSPDPALPRLHPGQGSVA